MKDEASTRWDARYRERVGETTVAAAEVLARNTHLLPADGAALDLACGLGGNALVLASNGLQTHAWDISSVAIGKLAAEAERLGLAVNTAVRDSVSQPPGADSFDVIVVSRFLDRSLAPDLVAALRRGGLLFYQTFTQVKVAGEGGPSNPDYLLRDNELLQLFGDLSPRVYREEALLGDVSVGFRNAAMLVAEKQ